MTNTNSIPSFIYEEAVELVERQIRLMGGNYIYERINGIKCQNVVLDDDNNIVGSCLVGRMLVDAGADPEDLLILKDEQVIDLRERNIFKGTQKALDYLRSVQDYQDSGTPWGEAHVRSVAYAEERNLDDQILNW